MSMRIWALALVVVGAAGWLGRGAFSDDAKPAGAPSEAEMEKMMEQLATPGEMHAWLAKFNGGWNVTGEFTEMDGSKLPMCGTACIRMVLGGRWQEQIFNATYKRKPFQGRGMTGYDNEKKQFTNFWFDTMSTSTAPATGTLSADGKVLTLAGEWEMMGTKMPFKYVLTSINACRFTFAMSMTMEGKEMAVGHMTYTRR